ncbi:MAG TPA: hypothetical protein VFW66_11020 [Gemmatimonadales bacterium]|nr:hypothetical protein [Gemmatimonadales bacterium]
MAKRIVALVALAAMVACSRGDNRQTMAAADSLKRDLQLAPVDTTQPLSDRPADTAAAPAAAPAPEPARVATPAPRPKPKPRSTPRPASEPSQAAAAPAPAPAPAPAAPASLDAGTVIHVAMVDSITSRRNKAGDRVRARVAQDVRDAAGQVVIPAGSTVTFTIAEIHESENKGDKTGKLKLEAGDITVGGHAYALDGTVESVDSHLQGRGTGAGDVAKVGAGAGIGAVAGRVIGGGATGAVIGGLIGGAVGAQRAVETKDRDVVVSPGAAVTIRLRQKFTAT